MSSLLGRLQLCDCNYTILLLSLFVLITLKLRGEACCQTDQSILVLVTVETIWLVRSIGVNKAIFEFIGEGENV